MGARPGERVLVRRLVSLLRERWAWWLVPLLLTLGILALVSLLRPTPEPTLPLEYDLPAE
jgi:hypothetical protein